MINLRYFEVETERDWLNIFNKLGNKSTLKYRREITPDIKVQADKIFVRNDLFEQVIKSCKATNKEFLMLKEKLAICPYEENYYTEETIQIQDNTEKPSVKEINKVSNKVSTKKLTKDADNKSIEVIDKVLTNKPDNKSTNEPNNKSINESDNKSINELDNKSINESDNKSINELDNSSINKEVNSNSRSWYDTDKFNKILATIDNNNFNHKNKIGKLKFNDINELINSIKGNTISEADTKKKINELNEIKKVEIKGKRLIESQKKLLSLFDDLLKTIFNVNESENESVNINENENESVSENENESVNESEIENESENENENESDDGQYFLKQINNNFKKINETKSLEDQINILKKVPNLNDYWYNEYYEDNKDINLRFIKLKLAHVLNDADDNLFKKIFSFTLGKIADTLINTTKKEDIQMIINHIEIKKYKIFEQDKHSQYVIQPGHKHDDLLDTIKFIQ